ncbi:MAG: xanthine dehydrogenase family protein molybdopterin-binding subunit [Pseudorhodoplanes sp.]|uniref:xanthine dehydrogenase family protein molybdopterin-binding subunit n=1 Tax=Pseudorhodoplanes sp. TaxID=1934341 RepID=UPI003D0F670E
MSYRFIGKSLPRTEDLRLIRGLGRYTADLAPPDALRLFVVRSPHGAARIVNIDTAEALTMPGVHLVLTGEHPDITALGSIQSKVKRQTAAGAPNFEPPYRILSRERALFVGDAVAAVFADTLDQARDAAEAIAIEWDALPTVTETRIAADEGAAQLWPQAPRNVCFVFDAGNRDAVEQALAAATHRVSVTYPINRITAVTMEPRTALGQYDPVTEAYTLHCGLQNPHAVRESLANDIFRISGNRMRVVSPDVGGGFGLKEAPFPEYVLTLVGAKLTGRPVLWAGERGESFVSDFHGRDNYSTTTLGLDEKGNFLALKVETIANIGAYISPMGLHAPTNNLGGLAGVYRTPHIHSRVTGVFSNTPPTAPYRGAGRPEATYAIERVIDVAARQGGFDPVELRRRNLIAPDQMPYNTRFVFTYDSGEFERNMDDALGLSEWNSFAERKKDAKKRGRLRGIGVANAIEISAGPAPAPMPESAEIKFDQTGGVTVSMGTHSHGQGHEITFAQIVADFLGLEIGDVRVRYGDTDVVEFGTGTFGSRSVITGSNSLRISADRLIDRGKKIAAVHFEADAADIVFEAGHFAIAGTDRRIGVKDVAKLSYTMRDPSLGGMFGFSEKTIAAPKAATFPNGCHVCEVEIDPDTGVCQVLNYVVVDDVGRVVNPALVKGQVHGGVVQGVGQILFENIAYDESGQLLSGSFMDYAMPRAAHFPAFICKANEVLTPMNPLGVKGAGEAGTVGALAAVINAIVDALSPYGIEHIDMPATPERIWRTINDAKAAR